MKPKPNILVGIDYSKNSENALREAARIADWTTGELNGIHIVENDAISMFRKQKDFDESRVMEAAHKHLKEYVESILGPDHRCQYRLRSGHPFEEILDEVKCQEITLLVLGSQGLAQKNPDRVGVLSRRCVQKAPVEVLLVRQKQELPYQKVIACIDFSETSKRAAHTAADIALQDGALLELLHIHTPPIYPYGDGIMVPSLTASYVDSFLASKTKKLECMAEELRDTYRYISIDAVVFEDSVSHGIRTHTSEAQADLVVLGTRGRTGLTSLLLGTKAEHIIHSSPCSVLAIKPKGFRYEPL